MNSILIYISNTGFSKKYVDSLSLRISDVEVVPFKKVKWRKLKKYDFIFFGAPLRNNKILGINKLLKRYKKIENKNIFIFATGIEPITKEKKENIILANGLEFYHVRLYLLPGGLDFSKLSKFKRKIIKSLLLKEASKLGRSENEIDYLFNTPIDQVNLGLLDKMVQVYQLEKEKINKQ